MARKVKDQNEETPENSELEEKAPEAAEAPAAESGPAPEEDKTAALEAELAAERDKYLRLAAEYDNYRKRSQKEREALYTDVRSETLLKILPVYDNIKRALGQPCEDKAYVRGVELIMEQIKDIFSKLGVTEIPAVGEQFDPEVHNAVMHVEDPEKDENVIVEEFQTGFKIGDKVMRHSMVKVAN